VLLPENQAGLLMEVLDVGLMVDQGTDEGVEPPLMANEFGHEIALRYLDRRRDGRLAAVRQQFPVPG
jgi:hypothetical protein